jgi:CspA family cold shock protein
LPTGKVKWFNKEKGFGFLSRDDGGDVFVHSSVLPAGVEALKPGQRVEFGVVAGQRGEQALAVSLLEPAPSVAAAQRRKPAELASIVQDLTTLLESVVLGSLDKGRYPDKAVGKKVATLLRAVADDLDV